LNQLQIPATQYDIFEPLLEGKPARHAKAAGLSTKTASERGLRGAESANGSPEKIKAEDWRCFNL
jgi:hypothetical protein